jgi:hypothetical protein
VLHKRCDSRVARVLLHIRVMLQIRLEDRVKVGILGTGWGITVCLSKQRVSIAGSWNCYSFDNLMAAGATATVPQS